MSKFQSKEFSKSILYALNGVRIAFKSQRNFRKHILIGVLLLIAAIALGLSVLEVCFLIFMCSFVLICELFNSVIEFVIDAYYRNKWAKLAKLAKDLSSGVVLISSCTTVSIAFILFLNKIFTSGLPKIFMP